MLLYVYAFLPETVNLYFNPQNTPLLQVGQEAFFYGALGIFLVCTLVLTYLKRSLVAMPVSGQMSLSKKEGLQTWADSLSAILNLFFIFTVSFIGLLHNDEHFNIAYFSFMVYLGPALLIGWIFYLAYLLFKKH
jgi:hypothetical protein